MLDAQRRSRLSLRLGRRESRLRVLQRLHSHEMFHALELPSRASVVREHSHVSRATKPERAEGGDDCLGFARGSSA